MQNGFPKRLRSLRKQRRLTQSELGQAAELHYQHIGRYERGESQPSAAALGRLAEALGVTVDYLVAGVEEDSVKAKLEDEELLKQFQDVEKLPEEDKAVVKKLLDAFLTKKKIQALVTS